MVITFSGSKLKWFKRCTFRMHISILSSFTLWQSHFSYFSASSSKNGIRIYTYLSPSYKKKKKKGVGGYSRKSVFQVTYQYSVQFSSVAQLCPTLCDPVDCSTPGLPVHHQLLEFTQTHVHWVSDAIQPSHPLSSPSPTALNLSQHLGLFQWVSSLHQVAKVLEFQLQHQSFQWTLRTDLL